MSNQPSGPAPLSGDFPRLAGGVRMQVDRLTGKSILLFPEGMIEMNATGQAIVEMCDGQRSLAEIVQKLAARFGALPELLKPDVENFLSRLSSRRLVQWQASAPEQDAGEGV